MSQPIVSIHDQRLTTVNDLVGQPNMIPTRVIDRVRDNTIAEVLFRNGGNPQGMSVSFERSTPLYLDGEPEIVGEYGEIPIAAGKAGKPQVAFAHKTGLGIRVSREMRDFNQMDRVNKQLNQLTATVIRANDSNTRKAFESAGVPEIAASSAWSESNSDPRHDIAVAMETIAAAREDSDSDESLGFQPDTIVLHPSLYPILVANEKFNKIFTGNLASESIAYKGRLPQDIMGLVTLAPRTWPISKILLAERGVAGFYADPRPLESTGLYPEGNGPNGGPTESFRSDTTQIRMQAVDEPLSAAWITGVQG